MKLKLAIFLTILINGLIANGQKNYISNDSAIVIGINLIDGGDLINSQICQVMKGNKTIIYTPYDLNEYGFDDGRVYISKEIQISGLTQKVFLERLNKGKLTLYYYKGKDNTTFFIEEDSTLFVEIPKIDNAEKPFSELLLNYTNDCPNVADACKLAAYNKKSFTKLFTRYNNCELKPFPYVKYGLFFGMVGSKLVLKPNSSLQAIDISNFNHDNNLYYGIFVDVPISVSDFSVFSSIGLYQSSFYANTISDEYDVDAVINLTSFKVPLLIRYTLPKIGYRPYINIGLNYTNNLRNESSVYMAKKDYNIIHFATDKDYLISNHQIGYACGLGMQYNLRYNRSLFIEFRYNKEYSLREAEILNINNIELISGINF